MSALGCSRELRIEVADDTAAQAYRFSFVQINSERAQQDPLKSGTLTLMAIPTENLANGCRAEHYPFEKFRRNSAGVKP